MPADEKYRVWAKFPIKKAQYFKTEEKGRNLKHVFVKEFTDIYEVRVTSDIPLNCYKTPYGIVVCRQTGIVNTSTPRICIKKSKDRIECDRKADLSQYDLALYILRKAEEKEPGIGNWLVRHGVTVYLDYTADAAGWADCRVRGIIAVNPDNTSNPVRTILHEYAHCREDIVRREKGLPPLEPGVTGEWKLRMRETKGTLEYVPVGHEARAVHYATRKMKIRRKHSTPSLKPLI